MKDKNFLVFLHQRLLNVYGEDYDTDFMCKIRAIIDRTDSEQFTPNKPGKSIEKLMDEAGI